jgi:hypothetical protein
MAAFLFILVLVATIYALGCVIDWHDYEQVLGANGHVYTRIRKHKRS